MNINSILNQTISVKFIIIGGIFWFIFCTCFVHFMFGGIKEGFEAGLVGLGSAINYKMGDGVKHSWENNNTIQEHKNPQAINDSTNIYSDLEKNEGGPIPLPPGELLIFDTNKFSPECCPSTYSNGNGCACASPEQMKYLNERGGNRTLTSEY
jgi:hypothetical protein